MEREIRIKHLSPNSAELPYWALKAEKFCKAEIGYYSSNKEFFIVDERGFGVEEFEASNSAINMFNNCKPEGNEDSLMMGEES